MVAFDLRAGAFAVFSLLGADAATPDALSIDPLPAAPPPSLPLAIIPNEPLPQVNLEAVWWTAPRDEPVGRLADRWGMPANHLRSLNAELLGGKATAGRRLLVYRHTPGSVSRSVGAPNRGRLENAVPFPEGDAWVLRQFRPRTFATAAAVTGLARSLSDWRERYPDASPVKLGEFSKRGGGRVPPHRSHRAGRDVDVGYVMLEADDGHRFERAKPDTLDGAATWGLVHRLLASGDVETIFMDASVQRLLVPFAVADLEPAQLEAYFSVMGSTPRVRAKAKLKAWRGHDNHMHVRFECTAADLHCGEAKSRKRRRRRRGSKKRSRGHRKRR